MRLNASIFLILGLLSTSLIEVVASKQDISLSALETSLIQKSPFVPKQFLPETTATDHNLIFNGVCLAHGTDENEWVFSLLHQTSGRGFLLSSNPNTKSFTGYQFQNYRVEDQLLVITDPNNATITLKLAKPRIDQSPTSSQTTNQDEDAEDLQRKRYERLQELRRRLMMADSNDED